MPDTALGLGGLGSRMAMLCPPGGDAVHPPAREGVGGRKGVSVRKNEGFVFHFPEISFHLILLIIIYKWMSATK